MTWLCTILLVEKDTAALEADRAAFESAEIKVIEATHLEEAAAGLLIQAFDLAVVAPDADGSRAVRVILAAREVPVILIAGNDFDPEQAVWARSIPFDGLISHGAGAAFWATAVEGALARFAERQQLSRYREYIENNKNLAIWTLDSQSQIVYLNSALSYSAEQPDQLFPELTRGFRQKVQAYRNRLQAGKTLPPLVIETKHLLPGGEVRWTESITTWQVENRKPGALLGVTHDITSQKLAEQALRDSEERLKQMASALHEAIWLRDTNTREVLYVNPAFETLTGIPREEFYQNPDAFINAIHPEDRKKIKGGVLRRSDIHRIIRRDGGIRWVWGRTFPVTNEQGKVYRTAAIVEDITERKHAEEELKLANQRLEAQMDEIQVLQSSLRDQVIRDPLTGLYNRRYLAETLDRELARAYREDYPVGLVMIDIDEFKQINDTYGHIAGDHVLENLALLLTRETRSSDLICRLGGDEFLLVLLNATVENAAARAEVYRQSFEESITSYEGAEIRATLSLGIAMFPIHGETSQGVLAASDRALYEAKENGRNRVVLAKK